jgi:signal transduction histidine kinase
MSQPGNAAASATAPPREMSFKKLNAASIYALLVVIPTVGLLSTFLVRNVQWKTDELYYLYWAMLVAAVELLPAPAWRLRVSLGFPILTAVGMLYAPGWAAAIAFVGSTDSQELKGQTSVLKALFNRSQVAIAVFLASSTFHALSGLSTISKGDDLLPLIPWALAASLVDYLTNLGLVMIGASLVYRVSLAKLATQLPRVSEFLISYVGLAILGAVLAVLFAMIQFWSVLTVIAPLLFARQMFLRSHALEEAHKELQEREEILRGLSNTMAEERTDERLAIASYLHDDLAQVLFRLSLQVDIARKLLEKGDIPELQAQLEKIRDSKQETSDRIRALIRDLHRSPLGAKGLSEALESFTDEVGRDSGVHYHRDIENIDLPAPITLLIFQIAREGVMNSLKHASATDMFISVREEGENIVLLLKDNGVGFDTGAPGPEGHYGMATMRERAKVGGGSFDVQSATGEGTTIMVRFPTDLLQRDQAPGTEQASANGQAHASPDTTGTTSRSDEGSRDSVRA